MALVLMDGFDVYNGIGANTGLAAKWTETNTARLVMDTGRFTGQSVRMGSSVTANGTPTISRVLPAATASFSVGFAFKVTTLTNLSATALNNAMVAMLSGATYMCGVWMTSGGILHSGLLTARNAGTSHGNSGVQVIQESTWHYIEFSGTISDTTGSLVVKVDGATVINLTNVDTRNGAPTNVDTVSLMCNHTAVANDGNRFYFDDHYVLDSATSLGERRIDVILPTADTATKQFVASTGVNNYACVDDATVDTTDFVSGSLVGDTDLYDVNNLSVVPTTIDAVQLVAFAQKTDVASRSFALVADISGTQTVSGNFALAASYGRFDTLLLTKPGGGAWDYANVNAVKVGPKVTV